MTTDPGLLAAVAADARTASAWQKLKSPAIAVLSLDIFDTLLFRSVPEPRQAFVLLGHRLAGEGLLPDRLTPSAFADLRVRAEERARAKNQLRLDSPECNLAEIYDALTMVLPLATLDGYVQHELDVEYELLTVDRSIAALAQLVCIELGKRVRLVSDTYFTSDQLRSLLDRPALANITFDDIAASCEYNLGKADGLFEASLGAAKIDPLSVIHLGDNSVADVVGAQTAGLSALYYRKGSDGLSDALLAEGVLDVALGDARAIDPVSGDHGLTALRARAVHLTEGAQTPTNLRPYWSTGATVLGPAFSGFATWVHERAAAVGAESVFCLMREGEFLADLIGAAAGSVQTPVASSPLWLSRQVCSLASVFTGSTEELQSFLVRRKPSTVAGLLTQTGADPALLPQLQPILDASLDMPGVLRRLLDALDETPAARAQVVLRAAQLRERLYRHLDRHLPAQGPIVFVDVGWGGTIQALVSRLLEARGTPRQVVGFYLATQTQSLSHRLDGLHIEGYLADAGEPGDLLRPILRSPELLEQVCMSDIGTLVGLDAEAGPLTGVERMPRVQVAQKVAVQTGVKAFQALWLDYRKGSPAVFDLSGQHARHQSLGMLTRLVSRPSAEEALAFGSWAHDDNFGSDRADPLVDADTLERVRYLSAPAINELTMRECYWPAGATRLANPDAAAAVDLLGRTFVAASQPAEPLEDHPQGSFEIYVDEGADFHNGPKDVQPLASDAEGRLLVLSHLVCEGAQRVRIDPPGWRALFRMDRLVISVRTIGASSQTLLDTRTFDEPGLALVGARWVAPGLLEITSDDPMIGFDLTSVPDYVANRARIVTVHLACARLSLPAGGLATPNDAAPNVAPNAATESAPAAVSTRPAWQRRTARIVRKALSATPPAS